MLTQLSYAMNETEIYVFLFSANLAFIVTNVYGWVLKEFHMPKPYRKHFDILFPAQRFVGLLYLAQLMEIPYLLMIGQAKALFYINAFSMLCFSSMMVVIGEGYFFRRTFKVRQLILYFLPMFVPVVWLLLAALDIVPATPGFYQWMFGVVCLVFLYYIIKVVVIQKKILRKVSDVVNGQNISDDGFPIPLSLTTRWLLLPIPILMFVCFLCNDIYVKMGRDILFTIVNVWFLFYTIKPHRKVVEKEAIGAAVPLSCSEPNLSKYKLSPKRCKELQDQIIDHMENEKPYLTSTLTIESLAEQINSNKSYVSEAINRSHFGSYYAMVNYYRVEHVIQMLKQNPKQKIEQVANISGFSSKSVFSQVFKRSQGVSATQFIKEIISKTETK